jgi:hypothetical protein
MTPCRFTGVFYVKSVRHGIIAINVDTLGQRHDVQISYFSETDDGSSYPEVLAQVEQERAYVILGSLVHRPRKDPLCHERSLLVVTLVRLGLGDCS